VGGQNLAVPIIRQAENLDENRVVLYKRSKQLGAGYFIVEISSTNTHLNIAAFDVESPESLLIELPEKRAQEILREFLNDYEKMACSLQVMNKRLVLLNPVGLYICALTTLEICLAKKYESTILVEALRVRATKRRRCRGASTGGRKLSTN